MSNIRRKYILGIDEVGLGAWAGPLCLGGVLAQSSFRVKGVRDSKQMTEKQRKSKIDEIYQKSIETQGILRDAHFINEHGIMGAWESAFVELVGYMLSLGIDQSHIDVIVDGAPHRGAKDIVEKQFPELSIQFWAKADDLFPHVSAASVMAKVYRDSLMVDLSREFPEYLWERNKGYGTPTHIKGLDTHGYTEYHREHARKAWPVRAISS